MKQVLMICIGLCIIAALTPAVSAGNITPSAYGTDFFVSGNLSGYDPTSAIDGNINTSWIPATRSGWWNYTNPYGMNITTVWYYTDGDRGFKCNDGAYHATGAGWNWINDFTPTTSFVRCNGNGAIYPSVFEVMYADGLPEQPVADFIASPTSGPATLYVQFNDTSANTMPTSVYNWSITPTTGVTGYLGNVKDHFAYFATPGNYTITHGVANGINSDIETKTDHIWVQNWATDYVTSGFVTMDAPRWVQLAGATINLLDVENNSWKNTSSSATGYETITTLSNHTINAYSSMLGYGDASLLSQPASDDSFYVLRMYPTGYANVSAGSVTLYVTIFGSDIPNGRLSGAIVNIAYELSGAQHSDYRITDASGIAQFVVPNQTTIYVYAEKVGYTRGGTTIASGNGNGGNASVYTDVTLQRAYVTTVPTATTLPGGGTPTTAVTVDPAGTPDPAGGPSGYSSAKGQQMMDLLARWGPDLVLLCIMVTILGLLGIRLGR